MKTKKFEAKNYSLSLKTKVDNLYLVGPALALRLGRLGIRTIKDLLLHFPARYEDLSSSKAIIELKVGEKATIKGKLIKIASRQSKNRRINITEAFIADDTSTLKAVFFNQPFLTRILKAGDTLTLAGKIDFKPYFGKFISNPIFEKTTNPLSPHLGRIIPIYPETKGLSSKWLRTKIKPLLKLSTNFADYLPQTIKDNLDLINLEEAIRQIHFPDFKESLQAAIKRLAFDELFIIALITEMIKNQYSSLKALPMIFQKQKIISFVKKLPFRLTLAQRRSAWEIIKDLDKPHPMNRLLNGDVGSGKTIVAAIAAYNVFLNGCQTAIMAPTEVLAYQHYQNFSELFKDKGIKIELVTSSYHLINNKVIARPSKMAEAILPPRDCHVAAAPRNENKSFNSLKSDLIIGTHAIIQENIKFKNLALAIIDEQHRFGVKQRSSIKKANLSNITPHLLSMTATPIPRTLSLALYGELDISTLDENPRERKQIKTYLVSPSRRNKAYDFIKKEVAKGCQVFVICPLIQGKTRKNKETSKEFFDFDSRKSAIEEYEKLKRTVFAKLKIGLLHGKMKSEDKEKVMRKFKNKKIDILVSTSVVEVGVDIQNATIMMIEGAEHFGLSQLHQLRGRVGRSKFQSYCFLFTGSWQEETQSRLKIMAGTSDGFKIAEADLKLRGPGEIYGSRQHGIIDLRFASLFDYQMIKKARDEAKKIISIDPKLKKYPLLLKKISQFEKEAHLE